LNCDAIASVTDFEIVDYHQEITVREISAVSPGELLKDEFLEPMGK